MEEPSSSRKRAAHTAGAVVRVLPLGPLLGLETREPLLAGAQFGAHRREATVDLRTDRFEVLRGHGRKDPGGFYGYLASQPELTPAVFRTAMFYGGVMGSFAVERFGTERLQNVTRQEIDERFNLFREISHLEHAGV